MKRILVALCLVAACLGAEIAAAYPDCLSSFSYYGECMDVSGQSLGSIDPWYVDNAMYCTPGGTACTALESVNPSWAVMPQGCDANGAFCRFAGPSYNASLFGGYSVPIPPLPEIPAAAAAAIAQAVDFTQLGDDVTHVGIAVIVLALLVISFILVRKHLMATTREERIIDRGRDVWAAVAGESEYGERVPFNFRDAWPAEQERRQWDADKQTKIDNGHVIEDVGGGSYIDWTAADNEHDQKRADERGMTLAAWREEKSDYDAASKKYFSDPEAREAAGVDWESMNRADAEHDEPKWNGEMQYPAYAHDIEASHTVANIWESNGWRSNEQMAAYNDRVQNALKNTSTGEIDG